MILFLILFDLILAKNFGLTVQGATKSKCKRKTFKGRYLENCSLSVPDTMQHITTDGFPSYYTSRMTSTYTLNPTKGMHVRLIFEVVDIDCKSGFMLIKEGSHQSQKLCTSGVQYPNVVSSGTQPVKLIVSVDDRTLEYRVKVGFAQMVAGCGKSVKNFPRSTDPCLTKTAVSETAGVGVDETKASNTYLQQFSWRHRQQAKRKQVSGISSEQAPSGPRAAELPPSMFDGNYVADTMMVGTSSEQNVTLITTTIGVMTSALTLAPTLPPITDPELIRFQQEMDRRYGTLSEQETDQVWLTDLCMFLP